MKKVYVFGMAALLCASLFVMGGCPTDADEGDGDGDGYSIAGTWTGTVEGEQVTYVFKSNGTFEDWYSTGSSYHETGRYTFTGTTLTITYDDHAEEGSSGSISVRFSNGGNTMTWTARGQSLTLTRVPGASNSIAGTWTAPVEGEQVTYVFKSNGAFEERGSGTHTYSNTGTYTFTGTTLTITYDEWDETASVSVSFSNGGNTMTWTLQGESLTLTRVPGAGPDGEDTVVNAGLNLALTVTAPVRGSTPVTAINTAQFTGTVAWQTAAGAAVSGTFAANTVYKAVITLAAKSGYTFTGFAGTFTYTGATVSAYAAGKVTITFPATAAAGEDTVVNAGLNLTGTVTKPVKDAAPDTTAINTAQYTGAVAWQTAAGAAVSGTFAANTVYKAVITLTAKSGYTFTGFTGAFTYTGATVSRAGTVVTITFPATAAALTWTAVTGTTFGTTSIRGIAYGGPAGQEKFVAVGDSGTAAWSKDGVAWTAVTGTGFGTRSIYDDINGIAYGGGRFVAVGNYGKAAWSTDGVSWKAVTDTTFGIYNNDNIYGIAYGGGRFVAGGMQGKAAYSTNGGVTWTKVADTTFGSDIILGITYGGPAGQERFVAGGTYGKAAYSTNGGVTWTKVTVPGFGINIDNSISNIRGIAYGGGRFVAVGAGGKAAYSTNGVSWTAVTDTAFGIYGIEGIAYGGPAGQEKFVAVGRGGKAAYSANGVSWTASGGTGFGTTDINNIAYGGGRFVAVGNYGKIAYSNKQE